MKLGIFELVESASNKAHTDVFVGSVKVATFPCCSWDKDGLEKAFDKQSSLIIKRIKERC